MTQENFYNNYLRGDYSESSPKKDEYAQYKEYIVQNFFSVLPKNKRGRILDIGIGNGETLQALKDLGYGNGYGVDIAEDLIEHAKERGLDCEHVVDTQSFLKRHRGEYDCIFLLHVLEHIPKEDAGEFLTDIRRALSGDGVLVAVVPSVQNPFYLGPYWDFTHINFFTERSLGQVCEVAGFRQVQFRAEILPINTHGRGVHYFAVLLGSIIIRFSRCVVNAVTKIVRAACGMMNPKVLSPNLIGICKK